MVRVPVAGVEARGRRRAPRATPPDGSGAGLRRRQATVAAVAAVMAGAGLAACGAGVTAGAAGTATAVASSNAASSDAATAATAAITTAAQSPTFDKIWSMQIPGTIAQSSPIVAMLDGTQAAVVGALNGKIYAVSLATGQALPGWPATDPGSLPIQSTPSVSGNTIYIGAGDAGHPSPGGYLALGARGTKLWYRTVKATPAAAKSSGVQASLTVGSLQGTSTVVAGSLGQYEEELKAVGGKVMPGFPWFAADSEFSTPSIAHLGPQGLDEIIEGGESTAGRAYGATYKSGGHIRVLSASGRRGKSEPNDGLVCQYNTTQGIESSPAVGGFLAGGANGIVVGTGNTYATASDSDKLIALGPKCGLIWKKSVVGSTLSSPALVSVAPGAGHLQVAEGTSTGPSSGRVYLVNGANGNTIWTVPVGGQVIGGITSANLGAGYQDLLVPTTGGLYVLNGRTGAQIALLGHGAVGLESSPLVTANANGTLGITVAGYDAKGGLIMHWDVPGTSAANVREAGAWPMFHYDPQLTGTTIGKP